MMSFLRSFICLFFFLTLFELQAQETTEQKPWRFKEAITLPTPLSISGQQRTRYEMLVGQFRPGQRDNDRILVLRSGLNIHYQTKKWEFRGELIDSRQYFASKQTPINPGIINSFALVQAYATIPLYNNDDTGTSVSFDLGRFAKDVGSRRLFARNRYRNTINNFTGIFGKWTIAKGIQFQPFYVLPVLRLPVSPNALLDNHYEYDEESFDRQFWGLFIQIPKLFNTLSGSFSFFGLNEKDSPNRATHNRNLYTLEARLLKQPQQGAFDFEIESTLQFGRSRASSSPTDLTNLTHFAYFQHLAIGYTSNISWPLRFLIQLDYASGDKSPDDTRNNRFDTLFGARRFDFGPTSIFGAFARSNLFSPGLRITGKPHPTFDFLIVHRFHWLASAKDTFTTTGLRDPSGNTGNFLGNQLDTRFRWDILPGNIRLELGFVQLFTGNFIHNAPNNTESMLGDTSYGYFQTTFSF